MGYSHLQLPFTIVQRANIPCLEPTRDTVEVESVLWSTISEIRRPGVIRVITHVTDAPRGIALLTAGSHLIGLTIDAWVANQRGFDDISEAGRPTNRGP